MCQQLAATESFGGIAKRSLWISDFPHTRRALDTKGDGTTTRTGNAHQGSYVHRQVARIRNNMNPIILNR